ncbi:hypothetical protein F383_05749 [Gossypium arboreum]|uniref:Uncharacterized protein n=1 Tax=Gossypium arboreum TaxID=29729 RepID=A0A0B0PBI7_GOSAR|nr:hypothetical protein F383_05749 [Gossypium arboreum]
MKLMLYQLDVRGFSRKQQATCIMQPLRSGKLL